MQLHRLGSSQWRRQACRRAMKRLIFWVDSIDPTSVQLRSRRFRCGRIKPQARRHCVRFRGRWCCRWSCKLGAVSVPCPPRTSLGCLGLPRPQSAWRLCSLRGALASRLTVRISSKQQTSISRGSRSDDTCKYSFAAKMEAAQPLSPRQTRFSAVGRLVRTADAEDSSPVVFGFSGPTREGLLGPISVAVMPHCPILG